MKYLILFLVLLVPTIITSQTTEKIKIVEVNKWTKFNGNLVSQNKTYEVLTEDYPESKEISLMVYKDLGSSKIYNIVWGLNDFNYLFSSIDPSNRYASKKIIEDQGFYISNQNNRQLKIEKIELGDYIPISLSINNSGIQYVYEIANDENTENFQKLVEDILNEKELKKIKLESFRNDFYNMDDYKVDYSSKMIPSIERATLKLIKQEFNESIDYLELDFNSNCELRFYSNRGPNKCRVKTQCDDFNEYLSFIFRHMRYEIPEIEETFDGIKYSLNREFYVNLNIKLLRGRSDFKIKNGVIVKSDMLDKLTEDQIGMVSKELSGRKPGWYNVYYQFGRVNERTEVAFNVFKK